MLEVNDFLDYLGIEREHWEVLRCFIKDMISSPTCRIFLLNLAIQSSWDAHYKRLFRNFFLRIADDISTSQGSSRQKTLAERIIEVVDNCNPPLYCSGVKIKSSGGRLSTITDAASLLLYNPPHTPTYLTSEIELFNKIESGEVTAADLTGKLRGRRPFRWVTISSAVDCCLKQAKPEVRVATLRNKLGLNHYRLGVWLVEIRYPEGFERSIFTPTPLDAGLSYYFRPANTKDGWGRAVDLSPPHLDGLPEAIHEECPIGPGFELRALGEPEEDCPSFDLCSFLTSLEVQWEEERNAS